MESPVRSMIVETSPIKQKSPGISMVVEEKRRSPVVEVMEEEPVRKNRPYASPQVCHKYQNLSEVKFEPRHNIDIDTYLDKNAARHLRLLSRMRLESYLMEKTRCSSVNPAIFNDFNVRLPSINLIALDNTLKNIDTLQEETHRNISCMLDAMLSPKNNNLQLQHRVHEWFHIIKSISAGIEGSVFYSVGKDKSSIFALKNATADKHTGLIHEAVIGSYVTNNLRRILPNFMYVYGYFRCSPVSMDASRNILAWCSNDGKDSSYLVVENIRNSVEIGDFVASQGTTLQDVVAVFLQVFNALNIAHKRYGYTHYDLHDGNVLVRKYDNPVPVPIYGNNMTIIGYVVSKYVPVIIDYGYSRAVVAGVSLGEVGMETFRIYNDNSYPMHDVYKLILFTGFYGLTERANMKDPKYKFLLELYSFFGQRESFIDKMKSRQLNPRNEFFNISSGYEAISHQEFISWILEDLGYKFWLFTEEQLRERNISIFPFGSSIDICRFYDLYGTNEGPKDNAQFCEVIDAITSSKILTEDQKRQSIEWIVNNFDFRKAYETSMEILEEDNQNLRSMLGEFVLPSGLFIESLEETDKRKGSEFVDRSENNYYSQLQALLLVKALSDEIDLYARSGVCVIDILGLDPKYKERYEAELKQVQNIRGVITQQRDLAFRNFDYIRNRWKNTTFHEHLIQAL